MKLHKCSICGRIDVWGETWQSFGSLALEECDPALVPRVCGFPCRVELEAKLESGEIELPKTRNKSGYYDEITRPQKGYRKQPSQRSMLEELAAAAVG